MTLGTDVAIRLPGGPALPAHLALPETPGPFPGVVVLHESFGLNDDIRRITQRFARSGYAAVAPDLYGAGAKALCVAKTLLSFGRGKGYAFDAIGAARDYLASQPAVTRDRIALAGFCLGGGFALMSAARGGYRAAAVQYGHVPRAADSLRGICPVVAGYGAQDRIYGPHADRLRRHLEVLGVPHDVKTYPDAGHSYMSQHEQTVVVKLGARGPMHVGYVALAAEDSWRRILAFFETHL